MYMKRTIETLTDNNHRADQVIKGTKLPLLRPTMHLQKTSKKPATGVDTSQASRTPRPTLENTRRLQGPQKNRQGWCLFRSPRTRSRRLPWLLCTAGPSTCCRRRTCTFSRPGKRCRCSLRSSCHPTPNTNTGETQHRGKRRGRWVSRSHSEQQMRRGGQLNRHDGYVPYMVDVVASNYRCAFFILSTGILAPHYHQRHDSHLS